jgi:hypothetical protein
MSFLAIMITLTVLISILAIYIPMLFIVTITFSLHFEKTPPLKQIPNITKVFVSNTNKLNIYKKLNVIRC